MSASTPAVVASPLAAVLFCPFCGQPHLDVGEDATAPHYDHHCGACGKTWRVEPYCFGVEPCGEQLDGSKCGLPVDHAHHHAGWKYHKHHCIHGCRSGVKKKGQTCGQIRCGVSR